MLPLFLIYLAIAQCQETLICRDETDYFQWLYELCIQSRPCRQLFHLYPIVSERALNRIKETPEREAFVAYRNERDFSLFRHQLSRILIFQIQQDERRLVLKQLVPDEWLPTLTIIFQSNASIPCSEKNTTLAIVISALYSMHLYKMVVADEFFCHDPNERLLLDPLTQEPLCICKKGKSCHNDSHFDSLITLLVTLLLFGMLIFAISIFVSLFYKRHLLNSV